MPSSPLSFRCHASVSDCCLEWNPSLSVSGREARSDDNYSVERRRIVEESGKSVARLATEYNAGRSVDAMPHLNLELVSPVPPIV